MSAPQTQWLQGRPLQAQLPPDWHVRRALGLIA